MKMLENVSIGILREPNGRTSFEKTVNCTALLDR
jgi:hypothetical protein